jgi:hypothetical protein
MSKIEDYFVGKGNSIQIDSIGNGLFIMHLHNVLNFTEYEFIIDDTFLEKLEFESGVARQEFLMNEEKIKKGGI